MATSGLPVQLSPTARSLRHMIRANAEHGFVYLNNPKVGCSTIKSALWSGVTGNLPPGGGKGAHRRLEAPFQDWFEDADSAGDTFVFTAVRNPFQRIVSAYLNKIAPARGRNWEGYMRRAGMAGQTPSFDAFIETLEGQAREHFDPHWRPQSLNVLVPFLQPNLLIDLEELDRVLPLIVQRLFPGRAVILPGRQARVHATDARESWRRHLADPATRARVVTIFEDDFKAFGYEPDLAAPPGLAVPVRESSAPHVGLAALLRFFNADHADRPPLLRAVEKLDTGGHLRAWALTQRLGFFARNPARQAEILALHPELVAAPTAQLRRAIESVSQGSAAQTEPDD